MIPRTGLGGGADMYIRSPEMSPATMPDRHHTSSTSIRSFTGLLNKMRQRWESGESGGGGGAQLVSATCYWKPSVQRVALDLQVCAPAARAEEEAEEAEVEVEVDVSS